MGNPIQDQYKARKSLPLRGDLGKSPQNRTLPKQESLPCLGSNYVDSDSSIKGDT